jgi:AcrR family transcriptional regulator
MSARTPRRDAVRNRSRLVDAAALAFSRHGLGASVNAIARDAGVNVATLYRHFPTKDDLIVAVVETILEPLAIARDHALALADGGDVLAAFVRETVRLQARQRGLVDALSDHPPGADVRDRLRQPAIEIVTPLVERAHRDGTLHPDFDTVDVLVVLRMLAVTPPEPERTSRYLDLVLRGLRRG